MTLEKYNPANSGYDKTRLYTNEKLAKFAQELEYGSTDQIDAESRLYERFCNKAPADIQENYEIYSGQCTLAEGIYFMMQWLKD